MDYDEILFAPPHLRHHDHKVQVLNPNIFEDLRVAMRNDKGMQWGCSHPKSPKDEFENEFKAGKLSAVAQMLDVSKDIQKSQVQLTRTRYQS